ncbi:MAG TPA: hypothetical protein VIK27_07710 [Candidatus Aquilonibacter sp.]
MARHRFDPFDQRHAVDVGQPQVDDDAVERAFVESAQGFGTGANGGDRDLTTFDQVGHRRELGDVIFDDEHVARAGIGEPEQVVESRAHAATALGRNDMNGDRFCCGVALELIEQLPAIDVRQPDVERDRIRHVLTGERDPSVAERAKSPLKPLSRASPSKMRRTSLRPR